MMQHTKTKTRKCARGRADEYQACKCQLETAAFGRVIPPLLWELTVVPKIGDAVPFSDNTRDASSRWNLPSR